MNEPLIIIGGPTAAGKTAAALELARRIGGAIISADSRQVYRGMSIGTAKPDAAECGGIEYSGIDLADFDERFDAAQFCEFADAAIERHAAEGRRTIIAGGTGMYLRCLLEGLFTGPAVEAEIRAAIQARARTEGLETLFRELEQIDPEAAAAIHPHDPARLTRALEVYQQTGRTISALRSAARLEQPRYPHHYFVLSLPRPVLYRRIEARIEQMLELGWLEEAAELRRGGMTRETPACKALGYGPLFDLLDDKIGREQALETIRRDTRRYAKRQLTWFRHTRVSAWFDADPATAAERCERMLGFMAEHAPLM